MAFTDFIVLRLSSGKGGDGVVRWLRERGKPKCGPSGGDGGKGGDVFFRAVRDTGILSKYKSKTVMRAENGFPGEGKSMHGRNGKNLIVDIPIGSVVKIFKLNLDLSTEKDVSNLYDFHKELKPKISTKTSKQLVDEFEMLEEGSVALVVNGGAGGFGNQSFKGSTNRRPIQYTIGKPGTTVLVEIELKLIADAGFVGEPNAGKTSLLNALTRVNAKTGSYAFTTLEPNIGVAYEYTFADIPGLIEDSSKGRGLGFKFLRHINRVKVLVFCISVERDNVIGSYESVLREMKAYDPSLLLKKRVLLLTKSDLVEKKNLLNKISQLKIYADCPVFFVSTLDGKSIKEFRDDLIHFIKSNF